MSGLFGALDTAATGVALGRVWMDATSDNVANADTVRPAGAEPFRSRLVIAQSRVDGTGVDVAGIREVGGQPDVVYDPDNPLADADGNVVRPKVDLTEEMTNMMVASRLYQANLSVMSSARESYQAALQIGR